MSKAIRKPEADWRQQYPENVSVLQAEPRRTLCSGCGQMGIIFNAHFFKENRVKDLCKACVLVHAGGEEKVYVRTSQRGLRALWDRNRRLPVPPHLHNARKSL